MKVTEKEVFDRFVTILTEQETLKADLKAFKEDVTFHKDDNPTGYSKEEVKAIFGAAKLYVKEVFEEYQQDAQAVIDKYKSITEYDV